MCSNFQLNTWRIDIYSIDIIPQIKSTIVVLRSIAYGLLDSEKNSQVYDCTRETSNFSISLPSQAIFGLDTSYPASAPLQSATIEMVLLLYQIGGDYHFYQTIQHRCLNR